MRLISTCNPAILMNIHRFGAARLTLARPPSHLWLVDLVSGQVKAQVAEYNGQIARGEDVISRIIYASKNGGGEELRQRVLDTINELA